MDTILNLEELRFEGRRFWYLVPDVSSCRWTKARAILPARSMLRTICEAGFVSKGAMRACLVV